MSDPEYFSKYQNTIDDLERHLEEINTRIGKVKTRRTEIAKELEQCDEALAELETSRQAISASFDYFCKWNTGTLYKWEVPVPQIFPEDD